ncbi:MAG: endolytic transglycosylase MltG [Flavobacterium sp.]|nr:endolytic transglycosylase MltG [Flavobacterium sp.]
MSKKTKTISIILFSIFAVFAIFSYLQLFANNTKFSENETFVHIPTNANYNQVLEILKPYVNDVNKFKRVAKIRSYEKHIKSGRFLLKKNMGTFAIVTAMRRNIAVKLAFNNQERLEDFAGRIGSQIEADSLALLNTFKEPAFLEKNGFNEDNVLVICIPNTYEMYWNTSAKKFRDKMLEEYQNFWTNERINQAKSNNLTPITATILASIVHKESVKKDERPRIASVYLNRLKIDMPLQADPTVIYAVKKKSNDFKKVIKRVIATDLSLNSPWNTYINLGLPPGPVAMPDITAIEAVLKPEKNDYLFFCASVEKFGYHEFARTFAEHTIIANKYREWINNQGIKR